ncbi:MAG: ribbon-helix-helix domain-containing protein [Planctomycetota bacterium]
MKARKSFLLRISPALYEALERWAQQEMRSVNGQIEYLLKEAVRKRGPQLGGEDAAADDERGDGA